MPRFRSALVALTICTAASACAQVQNKEDMMAAAGFTVVPANTPQREEELAKMPPHKFIQQMHNNAVMFVYADPTLCGCLYVGNQAAYDRYRANAFVQQITNEQEMTAQMNSFDWGPWGTGW